MWHQRGHHEQQDDQRDADDRTDHGEDEQPADQVEQPERQVEVERTGRRLAGVRVVFITSHTTSGPSKLSDPALSSAAIGAERWAMIAAMRLLRRKRRVATNLGGGVIGR